MRAGEESKTEEFLSGLECLDLSATAARMAGQIKNTWAKKGRTLTLADTLIAAVAIEHRYVLFTDNRKDFPMPEVQLHPLA
jgi:predicted nucleic acid-binding protein